ncbi:serine carboxypeptidase II-3-like [Magnolia sinica]|uniref:serine carboxypeptidase II-3-like n=1 Tax=Magnolia sinica TaxID=86752 RepID=UPI002658670D|nr:serine carboxypeptidase II-3-like [Magnolia sinica]
MFPLCMYINTHTVSVSLPSIHHQLRFLGGRNKRKMVKKPSSLLFFFIFSLLLCISPLTIDARQSDALDKLLKNRGPADDRPFEAEVVESDHLIIPQQGSKEKDKIIKLPGQPENIDFAHYGGYVTVDEKAGRALFYYFAEAVEFHQASKPLLLWLNGGPGCSSLGFGAMEELGPFRVMSDGKTLYRNKYAWNKVANVLFLESPAGVGFSYSNTTSDYGMSGDRRTAKDAYVFLVNWLERFPEYKNRDFYIAGESYAGHYVPQLAHSIIKHNEFANTTIINLKGITIGNAVIHDPTDNCGMYDYFWTHALISDEAINDIHKYCNFSPNANASSQPQQCDNASEEVDNGIGPINIYDIYAPLCFSSNLTIKPKKATVLKYDPCTDYYVNAYLNTPEVQNALHANVTKLDHPWSACSVVLYHWRDSASTVLPLLKEFMAKGIRVWVYSGDTDGRVPVTSTRYSLNVLKLPVKTPWRPWLLKREVGGYTVEYKGDITLVTVRGAGHEVPSYQPPRALALIQSFLLGKPLPSS